MTTGHRATRVLHSSIFFHYYFLYSCFYVSRKGTVSRMRNKPHSVSLLSFSLSLSFCFSRAFYYHHYSIPLSAGGGKTNTFPRGCVLKKHASNEKNTSHEKTHERDAVIKVSFGSFNYCCLLLHHRSNENVSLTHLMSGSPLKFFASRLRYTLRLRIFILSNVKT